MEVPKLKRSLVGKDTMPVRPMLSINQDAFKPVGNPIGLMALTQHTCRWPVDTKKGIMFCGSVSEGIYCERHSTLSRGKGTLSERSALRDAIRRDMSAVKGD